MTQQLQLFPRGFCALEVVVKPLAPVRTTGILRLRAVDLLLAYGLRINQWGNGWWRRRIMRTYGPFRGSWCEGLRQTAWDRPADGSWPKVSTVYEDHVPEDGIGPLPHEWRQWGTTKLHLVEVHRKAVLSDQQPWFERTKWRSGIDCPAIRDRLIRTHWKLVRARLSDETGWDRLDSPEVCADAIKVYKDIPSSIGYRALMALQRTGVWKVMGY